MDRKVTNFNTRLRTIRIWELAIGIIAALFFTLIIIIIFPEIESNDDLYMIVFLMFILLFFIYALRGTTGLKTDLNNIFLKENRNEILYVFAVNLIFAFIFTFFIAIMDMLIGITDPTWVSIFDIDSVDLSPSAFVLSGIISIIFAPLLEELIFRGVLLNRLKIRIGIIPSILITSILFAIGHDTGGMLSAFVFGICMCILYLKTDNILVPMAVHFINNLFAVIIETARFDYFISQFPQVLILGLAVAIAAISLTRYIIVECNKLKKANS